MEDKNQAENFISLWE